MQARRRRGGSAPACVCNRGRLPERPEDLADHALIHTDDEPWAPWFAAAAIKPFETSGPVFNDHSTMPHAAIDGRGIALARRTVAEGDLAARYLVRPFAVSCPATRSHYLVPPKDEPSARVTAFRDWILAATARRP